MVSNTIGNKFKLQDVIASLVNEETRKASKQLFDEFSQLWQLRIEEVHNMETNLLDLLGIDHKAKEDQSHEEEK